MYSLSIFEDLADAVASARLRVWSMLERRDHLPVAAGLSMVSSIHETISSITSIIMTDSFGVL